MAQDQEEAWRVTTAGGVFVVFEGGDGVGKTTQVDRLCAWLAREVHAVLKTFEPGDTTVGAMIRQIVLDPATGEMSPRAEALLYAADKAQHIFSVGRGSASDMSTRCWPTRGPAGYWIRWRSSTLPAGRPRTCDPISRSCWTLN